jgi:hypothetical protein
MWCDLGGELSWNYSSASASGSARDFSMVKTHPKMLATLATFKTGIVDHYFLGSAGQATQLPWSIFCKYSGLATCMESMRRFETR